MTKRKKTSRRRSYGRRFFKRLHKRDKRMPLSVTVGLATSVLASPAPGWYSVMDAVKAGKLPAAASSFIRSWTGIYGVDGAEPVGINVMSALNPLDMSDAPAWKSMFWTAIITKAIKGIVHVDPISKVPIVNKYLKFS